MKKKRFGPPALLVAGLVGAALTALCLTGFFAFQLGGTQGLAYATKFASILSVIDRRYVGEVELDAVSGAAYTAMLDAIGDRWSYYMDAEAYELYKQYQKNSYTGIGVTIEAEEGSALLRVAVVLEDSPAQKAGITIGDWLLAFDGESLEGLSAAEVKTLIAGKQGEPFTLTLRTEDGTERTVTVKAGEVHTEPVSYELLPEGIGYVRIKNFEGGAGKGVVSAVDALIEQGAKGIVFDVRGNPGGLLSELLTALDHLLPEGELFVSVSESGKENISRSDAACVELPMAVLIDENSYSAAEFFAAALSEYDWATLVGTRTTGKSRSQINVELTDGSAVHLSTNGYLTPKRVDLAETGGLAPDLSVPLSSEDEARRASGVLPHGEDGQLKEALAALEAPAA